MLPCIYASYFCITILNSCCIVHREYCGSPRERLPFSFSLEFLALASKAFSHLLPEATGINELHLAFTAIAPFSLAVFGVFRRFFSNFLDFRFYLVKLVDNWWTMFGPIPNDFIRYQRFLGEIHKKQEPLIFRGFSRKKLVAGAGFEPTTFRL